MVGRRGGPLEEQDPNADGPVTTAPAAESGALSPRGHGPRKPPPGNGNHSWA